MQPKIATIKTISDVNEVFRKLDLRRRDFFRDDIILIENTGIRYDQDFVGSISFGTNLKKLSINNGVTKVPFVTREKQLVRNESNTLTQIIADDRVLSKMVFEFRELEIQLERFSNNFFAETHRVVHPNISFRFCRTDDEGLHFDTYKTGKAGMFPKGRRSFKIFLNVDLKPRIWNIGPKLTDFVSATKDNLPTLCPASVNTFCYIVDKIGLLDDVSVERVEIPPGGMIIANGTTVAHQVIFGERMICFESGVVALPGQKTVSSEQEDFDRVVQKEGIKVVDHIANFDDYVRMDGSLDRAKRRLESYSGSLID
ncbi:hypothetical protein C7B61_10625 [filamentous cyanobacterium CCP1]|nr:hypothetical protein C7B61_10625 [filamentous cyanobacterium CCP1]